MVWLAALSLVCAMPDVQFPILCPACGAKAGDPKSATTFPKAGFVKLTLICAACRHQWEMEMKTTVEGGGQGRN